jgi:hypothetical protein
MPKFRKKPVVIEAIQLKDSPYVFHDYLISIGVDPFSVIDSFGNDDDGIYCNIKTLEGVMRASDNDYIIRGIKGEYYPCKPDIFELTYESVED